MRGKYDKYFQNEDGTITVATYNDPIHYKNEKGEWTDIDNTLIEDNESINSINQNVKPNKKYKNKDNPFGVVFNSKANSNELVSIEIDNYKISWGLDNSTAVSSVVKNSIDEVKTSNIMELDKHASEITYKNAFPNSDLKYSLSFSTLKEEIVLNEVPTYEDITFNVVVSNLIAKVQENNDIILYDTNDDTKEVFKISAPYMYDSAEKASYNENIRVILEKTEQGYKITHKLDTEWLNDESRVYPVIVDPTVTSSQAQTNIEDSYVNSWYPNSNYVMSDKLILGQSSGSNRTFIKITNMPSLPSGAVITDARLISNLFDGTYSWGALEIYELRSAWDSYTVTWNNHSSISKSYLFGGITPSYVSPFYKYNINVTSTVQKWYAGTLANWGFMLKYQDEAYNDYNWLYSSDSGISSVYKPAITITYNNPPIPTTYSEMNWAYPLPGHINISCGYNASGCAGHYGMDLGAVNGTEIKNVADGIVIRAYTNHYSAGNWIVVETNNIDPSTGQKLRVGYMHMNAAPMYTVGQFIAKGATVGYVGSTGYSTGNHLHFEVIRDGVNVATDGQAGRGVNPQVFWPDVPFTGNTSNLTY